MSHFFRELKYFLLQKIFYQMIELHFLKSILYYQY